MNITELIDTYCQAWNHASPERRAELLEKVLTPTASYTDPRAHTIGVSALLLHISHMLKKRLGAQVIRTSQVDVHHGMARFSWRVVEANGNELPESMDIVFLSLVR